MFNLRVIKNTKITFISYKNVLMLLIHNAGAFCNWWVNLHFHKNTKDRRAAAKKRYSFPVKPAVNDRCIIIIIITFAISHHKDSDSLWLLYKHDTVFYEFICIELN